MPKTLKSTETIELFCIEKKIHQNALFMPKTLKSRKTFKNQVIQEIYL